MIQFQFLPGFLEKENAVFTFEIHFWNLTLQSVVTSQYASIVSEFDWCLEFVRLRGLSLTSFLSFNLSMNYGDGRHS